MSKIHRFKTGKGIKGVTCLPNFILKFRGKIDSKKGSTVADAYIASRYAKCIANESGEATTAERILFKDRQKASVKLKELSENRKYLDNAPAMIDADDIDSIRKNRRNHSRINSAGDSVSAAIKELNEIYEKIISIDEFLEQRIIKTRKKALVKINSYISGLRAGKLKDYKTEPEFSDEASQSYHLKHSDGDEAIKQAARNDFKEVK